MFLFCLCLLFPGCRGEPGGLTIFCAASLSSTVQATAEAEGMTVRFNSGGSNTLVRQAVAGAQVDLLLLADDKLAKEQLVPKGYQLTPLASNDLVLIAPQGSKGETGQVSDILERANTLAVADAKTAPLGGYTEEALTNWKVAAKKIPLQDAGAVVSAVALGHAPFGIVYRSDALAEPKVQVVAGIPQERHSPVRYVAAFKDDASPEVKRLVESLISGRGRQLMDKAGFLPPSSESTP